RPQGIRCWRFRRIAVPGKSQNAQRGAGGGNHCQADSGHYPQPHGAAPVLRPRPPPAARLILPFRLAAASAGARSDSRKFAWLQFLMPKSSLLRSQPPSLSLRALTTPTFVGGAAISVLANRPCVACLRGNARTPPPLRPGSVRR